MKASRVIVLVILGALFAGGWWGWQQLRDAKWKSNEHAAIHKLRMIREAAVKYQQQFATGFPLTLAALGPAVTPGCSAANLLSEEDAREQRWGYAFVFAPGARVSGRGQCAESAENFTVMARPLTFGVTGYRSFLLDSSGAIRWTDEDRAARSTDPKLD